MEENPTAGLAYIDDNDVIDYDEDGNPIVPERNRVIDPLPPVIHSEVRYIPGIYNFGIGNLYSYVQTILPVTIALHRS